MLAAYNAIFSPDVTITTFSAYPSRIGAADEKKRLEYEARQKAIRDRDILIKTGENRGRKEIILSMIEAGLPLEQIAEITKETLETIQELKKKMG